MRGALLSLVTDFLSFPFANPSMELSREPLSLLLREEGGGGAEDLGGAGAMGRKRRWW